MKMQGKRYLIARNFVALGISTAWIVFIFIVGRLPFRGGNFSVMFYTVAKNISAYILGLFVMVTGFGLAFMVILYCQNGNPFSDAFLVFKFVEFQIDGQSIVVMLLEP